MTSDEVRPADSHGPRLDPVNPNPRCVRSEEILHGEVEVLIDHQGEIYRLRKTRNGKLILQK